MSAASAFVGTRCSTSAQMIASRRSGVSGNSFGCSGVACEPDGSLGGDNGGDVVWRLPALAIVGMRV